MHSTIKGNPFHPIYPFGTQLTLSSSVPMYSGGNRSVFTVEDVGDIDHSLVNSGKLTWGWLDTWQGIGAKYSAVWNWCVKTFGTQYRDYTLNPY